MDLRTLLFILVTIRGTILCGMLSKKLVISRQLNIKNWTLGKASFKNLRFGHFILPGNTFFGSEK